jgi:hypothetical protein
MPRKQSKANSGPKARKISINAKKDWKNILKQVEKQEVPLELLNSINIRLIDGTDISLDVPALLESSTDAALVEAYLNEKFEELDAYIQTVDFFINLEVVSKTVQEATNQLFKNLP